MSDNKLQIKIDELEKENEELKAKLKKYTNPDRRKKYYQNHKEELKEKTKEYIQKTGYKPSSEKRKEYNKRYYEEKKES